MSQAPLPAFEGGAGPIASRLALGLSKIALAARHELHKQAAASELSAVQAQLLTSLADGPLRVGELSQRLGLTASTVSESLTALEARKLIRRARSGRQITITATARGRALGRDLALWPDFLAQAVSQLELEQQQLLLRSIYLIIGALLERGSIQNMRMCVTCNYFRPNVHAEVDRPHHCSLVDLPFGDAALRIDCPDHVPAEAGLLQKNWTRWAARAVAKESQK